MKLILSSSPHAHAKNSVHSMMRDVILALLPAAGCGVYFFGLRALFLTGTCIAACLVTEGLCRLAMKRENSIGDLSATLTGLLLALNLPPDLPLWMAAVGGVFAIAVAKQAFGGLGYNPFNPALAARAFMLISFTGAMTTWAFPRGYEAVEAATNATPVDAVTCATPLALIICMKYSLTIERSDYADPVDVLIGDKVMLALVVLFAVIIAAVLYGGKILGVA